MNFLWWLQCAVARVGLSVIEALYSLYFRVMWRLRKCLEKHEAWKWRVGEWLLDRPSELTDTDRGERLLQWLCMMNGHGKVGWYNPGGFEPDMHCERCGEDIG